MTKSFIDKMALQDACETQKKKKNPTVNMKLSQESLTEHIKTLISQKHNKTHFSFDRLSHVYFCYICTKCLTQSMPPPRFYFILFFFFSIA